MNNLKTTQFFDTEYVDQASYDNLRKIASIMDGQKNASRKVLYTLLEKNITNEVKVSQLSSRCEEFSEYLHGSIAGVLVGMAQSFCGSNNLPLVQESGNFGTRFVHEASATRYIFASIHENTKRLFNKHDTKNLTQKYFEGHPIEYQFYVPSLPLLLINGSEGVSSGFAQKILPRNPAEIEKYILNKLDGGKRRPNLIPYYNGFNGTIEQGDNPKQWLIKGVAKRLSPNRVLISEIPVGYELKKYIDVLDQLEDDKFISSYSDRSDDDVFEFEVKIPSKTLSKLTDDELLQKLKLITKVTENYTCIDEHDKIKVFESSEEIMDQYFDVKQTFMVSRWHTIHDELERLSVLNKSKYEFIKAIVEDRLVINKRKKSDIVSDLDKMDNIHPIDGKYDYLLNMNITSLTYEKMLEIQETLNQTIQDLETHKSKNSSDLWLEDLK